ncbi:FAD/NAD(P)-binding protein [Pontibacter ramchanderi]|uniref:Putative NAD(P)/FAD-binding protein YdhS n=1 Tax=Pontibacter ramchanderi TaxID=1179743 RepID=A0A2N3UCV5_9BACT|nr:FAD/NAD(P)-binding protein [Pontibacter ramchanderi]PKV67207.1 putative NAD(P)/FAD-binding protein YdhS [Pontibacter ramchanderi]
MTIAIIGAGLSGTLTAIHLLKNAVAGTTIYLVEPDRYRMHRGVAYSSQLPFQPLNVPASAMSLFADEPLDFFHWLEKHASLYKRQITLPVQPTDFIPRTIFGDYLKVRLHEAEAGAAKGVSLVRVYEEALAVSRQGRRFTIRCSNQTTLSAHKVVLAMGNFPPAPLPIPNTSFYQSPRYVASPWPAKGISGLQSQEPLLLIGSSLTMVDLVGSLQAQGHQGKVYVVSRHGLLPQPFDVSTKPYPKLTIPEGACVSALHLFRFVRAEIKRAEAMGYTWRSVLDALRDDIPVLWQSLPLGEKKTFLRHVRPYWEVHRHRMPAASAALLQALQNKGQLVVMAATVVDIQETAGEARILIRQRHQRETEEIAVGRVINCTGPQCDYTRVNAPLVQHLLAAGIAQPDVLHLGLKTTPGGRLVDARDKPVRGLYTLGSPRKGMLYESTALREIRQQAKKLAQRLLRQGKATLETANN